ncbi:Purine-cytosine permease-like protein OS=Ureibacillus acetophenoni OX=614649 GN=SAMN05877842_106173 PE=3 SV=1 [Ureibacillus acetophenoni]
MTHALVVKKLLKIAPKEYEARQSKLYKWNPVGVLPLVISSVLGTIAGLGFMGTFLQNTATFFAAVLASILTILIAVLTKGKYYIKNESEERIVKLKKEKAKKSSSSSKEVTID